MPTRDELIVKLGREALAGPLGEREREQVREAIAAAELRLAGDDDGATPEPYGNGTGAMRWGAPRAE